MELGLLDIRNKPEPRGALKCPAENKRPSPSMDLAAGLGALCLPIWLVFSQRPHGLAHA